MPPASIIAKCFQRPGFVFALVFVWKIVLFVFTTQPVPSNDSFFYDGPVVNYLNGGGYFNPAVALALPISGTEVFCAYPPLYQGVLLGWMSVFGTSVVAAMGLHQALFGLYLLALLGIFRRLKTPGVWVNLAGLFLFVNTFQDRPDSLADWLGVSAIYAWVRAREKPAAAVGNAWDWLAAAFIVLALCTSLQFGGIFLGCLWVLAIGNAVLRRQTICWLPLATTVLIPVALVFFVKFGWPRWWEGFREHAAQTPGVTGWRLPNLANALKTLRTLPGVCLALFLLASLWMKGRSRVMAQFNSLASVVGLGAFAGVAALTAASMTFLSGNCVLATGYLQPLVVGIFLGLFGGELTEQGRKRLWPVAFAGLAVVGGVRAAGMTTWGAACAADVGYVRAMKLVGDALETSPPGSTVAVSAAYLYEAVRHRQVRALHSDWLTPARDGLSRADAVVAQRPAKMILTQFDRYRFYGEAMPELQTRTNVVEIKIIDTAHVPAPDGSARLQKVVQHISWAPVIVEFSWK